MADDKDKNEAENEAWLEWVARNGEDHAELTESEKLNLFKEQRTLAEQRRLAQLREEFRNAPESAPLLWANVVEEQRPYQKFWEEWLSSPVAMGIETLKRRWKGLADSQEIELYFAAGVMRTLERGEVQKRLLQEQIQQNGFALAIATPDLLALSNHTRLLEIQQMISQVQAHLSRGAIWGIRRMTVENIATDVWMWIELTPRQINDFHESLRKWMELERTYQGQATSYAALLVQGEAKLTIKEIIEHQLSGGDDERYRKLQDVALEQKDAKSGKGRTFEALPEKNDENT